MYCVKLEYLNRNRQCLGFDNIVAPGKQEDALRAYIRTLPVPLFVGQRPAYVRVTPEGGATFVHTY